MPTLVILLVSSIYISIYDRFTLNQHRFSEWLVFKQVCMSPQAVRCWFASIKLFKQKHEFAELFSRFNLTAMSSLIHYIYQTHFQTFFYEVLVYRHFNIFCKSPVSYWTRGFVMTSISPQSSILHHVANLDNRFYPMNGHSFVESK